VKEPQEETAKIEKPQGMLEQARNTTRKMMERIGSLPLPAEQMDD
jgi:hypothetical protein